jgi:hypothetical protein
MPLLLLSVFDISQMLSNISLKNHEVAKVGKRLAAYLGTRSKCAQVGGPPTKRFGNSVTLDPRWMPFVLNKEYKAEPRILIGLLDERHVPLRQVRCISG